jgi:hypothetical protein
VTFACAQEGLRLYPPGVFAVREAVEDMELCGRAIPRGTWVHVRDPAAPRRRDRAVPQKSDVPGVAVVCEENKQMSAGGLGGRAQHPLRPLLWRKG